MTTVGVQPQLVERVNALQLPSYAYHYPSFKRVQLAGVKEQLFHPNLPRLRRIEMDNTLQLLPEQHCRSSTTCDASDFARAATSFFKPPPMRLTSLNITDQGREIHRCYTTPEELKKTRDEWSAFLCQSPERFEIRLPEVPLRKDLHFTGYAVRYLRPDVTRSWRYTFQQEPMLDQYGQKPLPADINNRYRDAYPKYFRNVASAPWR